MIDPIAQIVLVEVCLPLKEPFTTAHGTVADRRIVLLELGGGDGCYAWSECVALAEPSYVPDTVDTSWLAIRDWIAPRVLGQGFDDFGDLHQALAAGVRGHLMAKAAVEMGIWGLESVRRGVSLSRLLGGTRRTVATGIALGLQTDLETLIRHAHQAVAEGYQRLKLKIQPGADLEPLTALRSVLGNEVSITADANSAYTLNDISHLSRLDTLGLEMIEQPLAWDDLVRHAELQKQLTTPICLDESITGLDRTEDMLALGSGRIVNLKPGRVGGLVESRAIHDFCRSRGVPLWCGGMLESGVGRAYNVALASLPGFTLPGDLSPSARYWQRDLVSPAWTMDEHGEVTVPLLAPGLGVEVDRDFVEDLTVRRKVLTP